MTDWVEAKVDRGRPAKRPGGQVTHYGSLDESAGRGDEKIQIDFRKFLRAKCKGFGNELDMGSV